jgi:amino acid adenylation domain-containing protein
MSYPTIGAQNMASKATVFEPSLSGIRIDTGPVRNNIYSLFRTAVRERADSAAVVSDDLVVTFAELGERVSELAARLTGCRVGPGSVVAIQCQRSPLFLEAALATLSLDAIFAPLSVDEPYQRMLDICHRIHAVARVHVQSDGRATIDKLSVLKKPVSVKENNPIAYILHTSGSTGTPKGVAIPHSALSNCLNWHIDKFDVSEASVVSHLNLPSFDFSITELLLPIAVGGTIAMPSGNISTDVVPVISALGQAGVSIIQMVPTVLGRFLRAINAVPGLSEGLATFRAGGHMICNGEPLPDSMRREFYRLLPNSHLHNCYGPTETCVAITEYLCPKSDSPTTMYIGTPVPNVDVYIADDFLRPASVGAIGELLIGGRQLATGYIGNREETLRRFVTITIPGGSDVVYRSGDLVRLSSNGLLEFVGRVDNQLKYLGVRIEPEEIESVAERSGLCEKAVVVVATDNTESGRQRLVLFASPTMLESSALRSYLATQLPPDRRPNRIVLRESMPITERGKLNRQALAMEARELITNERTSALSRQPAEARLANTSVLQTFLATLSTITRKEHVADELWAQCDVDSLGYLDLELSLLERRLRLSVNLYERPFLSLREIADQLEESFVPDSDDSLSASADEVEMLGAEVENILSAAIDKAVGAAHPTIVLHSSLVGLNVLHGRRAESAVISAIGRLLSRCTILLPAFTPSFTKTRTYHFTKSKSETGLLATHVFSALSAVRTAHPVYSFVGVGLHAARWAEREWWRSSPLGSGSQFEAMSIEDAVIVMLGTTAMAHPHRCEYLANVPYMRFQPLAGRCDFGPGYSELEVQVYEGDVLGCRLGKQLLHNRERLLASLEGLVDTRKAGGGTAHIVRVKELEQRLTGFLCDQPLGLVNLK